VATFRVSICRARGLLFVSTDCCAFAADHVLQIYVMCADGRNITTTASVSASASASASAPSPASASASASASAATSPPASADQKGASPAASVSASASGATRTLQIARPVLFQLPAIDLVDSAQALTTIHRVMVLALPLFSLPSLTFTTHPFLSRVMRVTQELCGVVAADVLSIVTQADVIEEYPRVARAAKLALDALKSTPAKLTKLAVPAFDDEACRHERFEPDSDEAGEGEGESRHARSRARTSSDGDSASQATNTSKNKPSDRTRKVAPLPTSELKVS
jgi:hypothetical protein